MRISSLGCGDEKTRGRIRSAGLARHSAGVDEAGKLGAEDQCDTGQGLDKEEGRRSDPEPFMNPEEPGLPDHLR
jgi:hypothetical protein